MIGVNFFFCISIWAFFGFQHSLLARPSTKIFIKKIFGKKFETHFYPVLYFISQCIIFLAIYDAIRHLEPSVIFFEFSKEKTFYVYWFNQIANILLIISVFHFDIGRFIGLTQLFQFFFKDKNSAKYIYQDTLNKDYLYRYIRHPMYLGIILVFISSTTIYTDLFFVNLFCILTYIEIGSYFEEKSLMNKFGKKYINYKQVTKSYIPGIR